MPLGRGGLLREGYQLRQDVCEAMLARKAEIEPFIVGRFDTYVDNMLREGSWGGEHLSDSQRSGMLRKAAGTHNSQHISSSRHKCACQLSARKTAVCRLPAARQLPSTSLSQQGRGCSGALKGAGEPELAVAADVVRRPVLVYKLVSPWPCMFT